MAAALRLGRRNLGHTGSNPSVATLLVKDDAIIGCGMTAKGGRPHAEILALAEAGIAAKGAIAYVTLEPCAHHGNTPPCCDALIEAGVGKVVIPMSDPNPLVAGKGLARLRAAGIEVVENICAQEARRDHAGHILRILEKRPFVQMKMAITANGMAGRKKQRLIVSGEEWQAYAQLLRTQCDAILTGIGTAIADDPLLTCRLPGLESRSPHRLIFDRHLRLPVSSKLAQTAKDVPLTIFTMHNAPAEKTAVLEKQGVNIRAIDGQGDFIAQALHDMSTMGFTRLLLEGGPRLVAEFLERDLVDEILIAQNPMIYEGEDAISAFTAGHWQRVTNPAVFAKTNEADFGQDRLQAYWRTRTCLQG